MELEQIKEELNKPAERIKELENKETVFAKRWEPKEREAYFFIRGDGYIGYTVNNMDCDKKRIAYLNVFKTEEEAEREASIRQVWLELREFNRVWNIEHAKGAVSCVSHGMVFRYEQTNQLTGILEKHFGDRLNLLNF